jgi:transcriptional regulator
MSRGQPTPEDIDALIASNPLGLVVTMRHGEALSTPLPFVLDRTEDPSGVLHGHFNAADPQIAMLRTDPRALIAFRGPGSYISPSWMRDRAQAPTWFYTFVEFVVEIEFLDGTSEGEGNLERLVDRFEAGRENRWTLSELGSHYEQLFKGVRPFKAWILRTRASFELGQNNEPQVLGELVRRLRGEGKHDLAKLVEEKLLQTGIGGKISAA